MSHEPHEPGWPPEAGSLDDLPRELEPPPQLEDRVTRALARRGLLAPAEGTGRAAGGGGDRGRLWAGRLAAALAFLAIGLLLGWRLAPRPAAGPSGGGEAPAPRYALLLYETEVYDRAEGAELLERYRQYSEWVAEARDRGQFVTGEDFSVEGGWVLPPPAAVGGQVGPPEPGATAPAAAVLSGVFVISAGDEAAALSLARRLPHLRHGGHVVVQRVVPTEQPPAIEAAKPIAGP